MKCVKCFSNESIESFSNCNIHGICKECKIQTSKIRTTFQYNFSTYCPCCL